MDPAFLLKALGFCVDPPLDRVQPAWWEHHEDKLPSEALCCLFPFKKNCSEDNNRMWCGDTLSFMGNWLFKTCVMQHQKQQEQQEPPVYSSIFKEIPLRQQAAAAAYGAAWQPRVLILTKQQQQQLHRQQHLRHWRPQTLKNPNWIDASDMQNINGHRSYSVRTASTPAVATTSTVVYPRQCQVHQGATSGHFYYTNPAKKADAVTSGSYPIAAATTNHVGHDKACTALASASTVAFRVVASLHPTAIESQAHGALKRSTCTTVLPAAARFGYRLTAAGAATHAHLLTMAQPPDMSLSAKPCRNRSIGSGRSFFNGNSAHSGTRSPISESACVSTSSTRVSSSSEADSPFRPLSLGAVAPIAASATGKAQQKS